MHIHYIFHASDPMQLTMFTDYALRVLMMVGLKDGELATIPEISERYGISRNHLMKVVHHLSRAGYLATVRGKGGGIRLARPASEIRIGAVIRDTEEHLDLVACFDPARKGECVIEPACELKRALGKALDAFLGVMDGYTLADLIAPSARLRRLLAIGETAGA